MERNLNKVSWGRGTDTTSSLTIVFSKILCLYDDEPRKYEVVFVPQTISPFIIICPNLSESDFSRSQSLSRVKYATRHCLTYDDETQCMGSRKEGR